MNISSLNPFTNPGPFHVLAYGTLLGTNIFQSFVAGIVAFRALPRASFSQLQQAITPYYFAMQTILPIALILTWPASKGPWTQPTHIPNGVAGVLGGGTSGVRNALVGMAVMGVLNWAVIGPMVTGTMKQRKVQETRDGKKYFEKPAGGHSAEMQRLNSRFMWLHGVSSLVNMFAVGACAWYGVWLGGRL